MAENDLLKNSTFQQDSVNVVFPKDEGISFWKKATGIAAVVSLATSIDLQEPNKDLINSITNPEIIYSPFLSTNEIEQEAKYIDDAPLVPKRLFSMKAKLGKIRKLEFEPIEDENGII